MAKLNDKIRYVENSFDGKSSFIIVIDDIEYISNGCVFVENTPESIQLLIKEYDCEEYIDELLQSPWININTVTNAWYMFMGCTALTEFNRDMNSATHAWCMLDGHTALTEFNRDKNT